MAARYRSWHPRPSNATAALCEIVTLLVGPDEQKISLHAPLLTETSDFFEAALNRNWQEALTKTIKLPETDPAIFAIYTLWLYGGDFKGQIMRRCLTSAIRSTFEVSSDQPTPVPEDFILAEEQRTAEQRASASRTVINNNRYWLGADSLVKAYIMGDHLRIRRFQNLLIDMLVQLNEETSRLTPYAVVKYALARLPVKSTLHKLLVDEFAAESHRDTWDGEFHDHHWLHYSEEFRWAVTQKLVSFRFHKWIQNPPYLQNTCDYHEHTADEPACVLKKPGKYASIDWGDKIPVETEERGSEVRDW